MLKIFVSYRREDTLAIVGRIGDRLRAQYGRSNVYIDVEITPPGVDFRHHFMSAIENCDVVLALIGEYWLPLDATQPNRLFDRDDFVRMEIEAALARNIPVIPVLVGKARMAAEPELPPSLVSLVYRTAIRIDEGPDFHHHMDRVIRSLSEHAKKTRLPATASSRTVAIGTQPTVDGDRGPVAEASLHEGQQESLAALDARAPPRPVYQANWRPIRLSLLQGLAVTIFLLILNSILAALGSMLWGQIPYWPAYMIFAMACAFFRYWGLLVAVLTPVVSSLLLIGGAPAYMYVPVDGLQGVLVICGLTLFHIDPGLNRLEDKLKYLLFGVTIPSTCGACFAWWLRSVSGVGEHDAPLQQYAFSWVLENLLPVIFPGIWLHKVVGSLRLPFAWTRESYRTGWVGQTLEYLAPWTLTLFLSGSITLVLVTNQLTDLSSAAWSRGLGWVDLSPKTWSRVQQIAAASSEVRWLVFSMCVSMLISVGFAIRQAHQAWQLEQAVRRHTPTPEEAERILSGKISPSERKIVSLMYFGLTNFIDGTRALRPPILIDWLNVCFDCLAASAARYGGHIDHFDADGTLLIFGLRNDDCHANSSLLCTLDIIAAFQQLNDKLAQKNIPGFKVNLGIHTGPVTAGEVGSGERRHYTVVGDTVDATCQIARETRNLLDGSFPALISSETLKDAGLFGRSPDRVGLVESQRLIRDEVDSLQLYAIDDSALIAQSLLLAVQRIV
jgi:class 3 adenylate cyclase